MWSAKFISQSNEILSPHSAQPSVWPVAIPDPGHGLEEHYSIHIKTFSGLLLAAWQENVKKNMKLLVPVPWACFTKGGISYVSFCLSMPWSCSLALLFLEWPQGLDAQRSKTVYFSFHFWPASHPAASLQGCSSSCVFVGTDKLRDCHITLHEYITYSPSYMRSQQCTDYCSLPRICESICSEDNVWYIIHPCSYLIITCIWLAGTHNCSEVSVSVLEAFLRNSRYWGFT